MNEKEKAKELVNLYMDLLPYSNNMILTAKQMAKIAVNEILNLNCVWYEKEFAESKNLDIESTKEFWQSVLKAI